MTDNLRPPPSEWNFEDIKAALYADGASFVTFRQGRGGPTFFMSSDAAEEAAKQFIEAAQQARSATGQRSGDDE